jgi:hypothetical protein
MRGGEAPLGGGPEAQRGLQGSLGRALRGLQGSLGRALRRLRRIPAPAPKCGVGA